MSQKKQATTKLSNKNKMQNYENANITAKTS